MKKLFIKLMVLCVVVLTFSALDVFAADDGYLKYLSYEISNGEVTITKYKYNEIYSEIEIPKAIDGYPVTAIGDYAFDDASFLTSLIIPDTVKSIGDYAFSGCRWLPDITIPDSVTIIGDYAFSGFYEITSIIFPESVDSMGNFSFKGYENLIYVRLPKGLTTIGAQAFENCVNLESIVIPDSVTSIGNYAFYGCSKLSSASISNSVTTIGEYAFSNCVNLTSIAIPNSVTTMGDAVFGGCINAETVSISNKLTSISKNTFSGCNKLESVYVPDNITTIEARAFYSCKNIKIVSLPDDVTIGDYAFAGCENLDTVCYRGTEEEYDSVVIGLGNSGLWYPNFKFEVTQTTVSNGGKSFSVAPTDVDVGSVVILSLYDGKKLIETQRATYNGNPLTFTTNKAYEYARVMVWESVESLKPIGLSEKV